MTLFLQIYNFIIFDVFDCYSFMKWSYSSNYFYYELYFLNFFW